ncbi:VWA domain-containing protein [candidate division WOR-3 bacterium]|nr:VWA domain-containing protein [candidate division WOR-3 bacterium]
MIRFSHPWLLVFIPAVIALGLFLQFSRKPSIVFSASSYFSGRTNFRIFVKNTLLWFYVASSIAAILGAAEPLGKPIILNREKIGIDIVLALDLSTSMEAPDFSPTRFEAAKKIATDFIDSRENDRIGIAIFAYDAYLLVPPTLNHSFLVNSIKELTPGMITDGTAIGMGLALAANGLRDSECPSKVIILITDGANNAGYIDPVTASEAAKALGIKIYTIGIGTQESFTYNSPTYGYVYASTADYDLLDKIASSENTAFRATDRNALKKAFSMIDRLEKTTETGDMLALSPSKAHFWVIASIVLIAIPFLLDRTFFRSIP